jgi:hypothetical protein
MRKLLLIAVVFCIGIGYVNGQGELDEQQKVFIRNEKTFAILLNTDGYGISYREGRRIDYFNKKILDVDIGTLRHPKEVKLSNPYYQTPGTFVFGKLNSIFFIRAGLGHQREIFRKADLGGVAVRYFYSGGPAIVFCKPIYYKILDPVSSTEFIIREEKFDVKKHEPSMIYSRSSFLKGLDETKVLPGIFVKGGFNFEYSKEDKLIHAIELGAQANLFLKKVPIMATEKNKALFFSLFASYRFGIVIDPLNPESRKFSNFFQRRRQ